MATIVPPVEGTAPASSTAPVSPPVFLTTAPPVPVRRPLFGAVLRDVNRVTAAGAICVLGSGLAYASAEWAYAILAGATDPASYGWVFDLYGVAYLLFGLGILLGLAGLGGRLLATGGGVAFFGTVLIGGGYFAYAALRDQGVNTIWTDQLDAVGFLILTVGLMLAFAGLATQVPRGIAGLRGDVLER